MVICVRNCWNCLALATLIAGADLVRAIRACPPRDDGAVKDFEAHLGSPVASREAFRRGRPGAAGIHDTFDVATHFSNALVRPGCDRGTR